jgi:hypothetical protein
VALRELQYPGKVRRVPRDTAKIFFGAQYVEEVLIPGKVEGNLQKADQHQKLQSEQ